MQHFRVLETWRLATALGVMAFHFMRYAPADQRAAEEVLSRGLPLMDMFFMISGLLIFLRYSDGLLDGPGSYLRFIGRRFARIYPLFAVTLLFFVVVGLVVKLGGIQTGWAHRFDFALLPWNILLVQGWGTTPYLTFNYVAWTLSAEWFCYLALPLIVVAWRRGGAKGLALLAAATIALLQAATMADLVQEGHWLKTYHLAAYRAFADFTLGALIAVLVRSSTLTLRSHWPAWLLFGATLAGMLAGGWEGYPVLALLATAIFLAALAERNNPEGSHMLAPLSPVGRVSFGIYMIHPVVEVIFFSVIWRMALEQFGVVDFFVFWTLPMAVAVALAMASDRWFERPVARWLIERIDRRVPASRGPAMASARPMAPAE